MIRLESTFLNSIGKSHRFSVNNPDTTKSPEEIKELLTLLTTLDIFEKDGVGLFKQVVKAKYVETIVTPIFEGNEMFGDSSLEEPEVEGNTPEQLTTLRCTWQETPKVPEVSIDLPPIRSEVHEALRSASEKGTEIKEAKTTETNVPSIERTTAKLAEEEPLSPPAGSPYDVVKEMFRRRKRRKAKEQERRKQKEPPESPS